MREGQQYQTADKLFLPPLLEGAPLLVASWNVLGRSAVFQPLNKTVNQIFTKCDRRLLAAGAQLLVEPHSPYGGHF